MAPNAIQAPLYTDHDNLSSPWLNARSAHKSGRVPHYLQRARESSSPVQHVHAAYSVRPRPNFCTKLVVLPVLMASLSGSDAQSGYECPPINLIYSHYHNAIRGELARLSKNANELEQLAVGKLADQLLSLRSQCRFLEKIYKYHSSVEDEVSRCPYITACFPEWSPTGSESCAYPAAANCVLNVHQNGPYSSLIGPPCSNQDFVPPS